MLDVIPNLEAELETKFQKVSLAEIEQFYFDKTALFSCNDDDKITGICINDFRLKEIPKAIMENTDNLSAIVSLNLQFNEIEEIKTIIQFKGLKKLLLNRNRLKTIPDLNLVPNLEKLSLSGNEIENTDFLKHLDNLKFLDLEKNKIKTIEFIHEIKQLQHISLRDNLIQDINLLKTQETLTKIDLSNNYIAKISYTFFKANKEQLQWSEDSENKQIEITDNPIPYPNKNISEREIEFDLWYDIKNNEINLLTRLEEKLGAKFKETRLDNIMNWHKDDNNLFYSYNENELVNGIKIEGAKLDDCPIELYEFTNIITLNLSDNKLKKFESKRYKSKQIKSLNLYNNNIDYETFSLENFTQLKTLYIGKNWIKTIPDSIFHLLNLEELGLSYNRIMELPISIGKLKKLKRLYIRNNYLETLPKAICSLTNLIDLEVSTNNIKSLPYCFQNLNKLRDLNLSNNRFRSFPIEICSLSVLENLSIDSNNIEDLPDQIKNLTKLKELNISRNQLNNISPLINLPQLEWLNLNDNHLTDISPLKQLINLKSVRLFRNVNITEFDVLLEMKKLEEPPREILMQGSETLNTYFREVKKQGRQYLFEAKMLILGEGGSGKTSLAYRILDEYKPLPLQNLSTRGIEITSWSFPHLIDKTKKRRIKANLWDFGGQHIYHATHKFFLSSRSLYVIVDDSRQNKTDYSYWLSLIETFGGESPVLLVLNEKDGRKVNVDNYRELVGRFPNLKRMITVDLKTNKNRNKLLNEIKYQISALPQIGTEVPKNWKLLRRALEQNNSNFISLTKYKEICKRFEIDLENASILSQFFHELGIILHFKNSPTLKEIVFLKPYWITKAVYKLIDNQNVIDQKGAFNLSDTEMIWNEDEFNDIRFKMLELMKRFYLIYEIKQTKQYISPAHLSNKQPQYSLFQEKVKTLTYKYDAFMPRGIIHQFIVRTHEYIKDDNLVWQAGVVLEKNESFAEIIEKYSEKEIQIKISGKLIRDMLMYVKEAMDEVNKSFTKLKFDLIVPCNCKKCSNSENPKLFEYSELEKYMKAKASKIKCTKSFVDVNVLSLIDDTFDIEKLDVSEEIKQTAKIQRIYKNYEFTGPEKRMFDKAFESAFSSYSELKIMLSYIDIDLDKFSNSKRNKREAISDIRDYALRHYKVLEIIDGALDEVPTNEQLQALKQYWEEKTR